MKRIALPFFVFSILLSLSSCKLLPFLFKEEKEPEYVPDKVYDRLGWVRMKNVAVQFDSIKEVRYSLEASKGTKVYVMIRNLSGDSIAIQTHDLEEGMQNFQLAIDDLPPYQNYTLLLLNARKETSQYQAFRTTPTGKNK